MKEQLELTGEMREAVLGQRFTEVDGRKVLGIGLVALFLFRDGSTPVRRQAVAEVVQEYLALTGDHIRWRSTEEESIDLHHAKASPLESAPGFTFGKAPFSFYYSGGDSAIDASAFELGFSCAPSWDPIGTSKLYFALPLAYMNSDFIVRFQRIASMLNADQAYGGVGAVQCGSSSLASSASYLVYALATQYPGMLVHSFGANWESYNLAASLSAANWLTAVSDRYLERLGGWEVAARGLDPRIAIYKYDGGVIFQAGAKPDLGDAGKGSRPELYREVARALKPLRFSGQQGGFYRPNEKGPTFDAQNTALWLNRFD